VGVRVILSLRSVRPDHGGRGGFFLYFQINELSGKRASNGVFIMRLIVVGQGPFGEKVLEALINKGEEVVGVFSPPDKRGEPMTSFAQKSGIFSHNPPIMKDPQIYDEFVRLKPDLTLLAFVTDIIPGKLLNVPTLGTICYHPSFLPRHRGASAINWAIIQGDTRTGLTIFWVDEGIDTGPILLQKEVAIGPDDTAGSLYFTSLFPMGVEAMVEAVELIKNRNASSIPQDDSKATYEPPCDDRVASLKFNKAGREVYNIVRGCDPHPGAYATLKGKKVRLYEASFRPGTPGRDPGEIVSIEKKGIEISLKDGIIRIGKLRMDKGEKMGAIEFARSVDLNAGDRFISSPFFPSLPSGHVSSP
jgi:methionyl-tRNA formyltransferase